VFLLHRSGNRLTSFFVVTFSKSCCQVHCRETSAARCTCRLESAVSFAVYPGLMRLDAPTIDGIALVRVLTAWPQSCLGSH
jgi:hypothetical protein